MGAHTRSSENGRLPATLMADSREIETNRADSRASTRATNGVAQSFVARGPMQDPRREQCGSTATVRVVAGHGRCVALRCGRDGDRGRSACQVRFVLAKQANRRPRMGQKIPAHRGTMERGETLHRTRRRRRQRLARLVISTAVRTGAAQGDSQGMSARSVMTPSVGVADTVTRCVRRRRFPACATRRGSAERPKTGFRRPFGGSDLGSVHRCVVCQDVAGDAATIERTHRDATVRRLPAGPAPARLSTEATSVARSATTNGQMRESADSNERARPTGGAGQESRAAGLDASPRRIGSQRPFGGGDPSRVE
jgi:hypothetical protein